MAGDLSAWAAKVSKAAAPAQQRKMLFAAGKAMKATANGAANPLRNGRGVWGRKPTAGFDLTGAAQVTVNHRPPGVWALMSAGRQGSGPIFPRTGSRVNRAGVVPGRAVMTPEGPRARSSFRPSRPPHPDLIKHTFDDEHRVGVEAAHDEWVRGLTRAVKG